MRDWCQAKHQAQRARSFCHVTAMQLPCREMWRDHLAICLLQLTKESGLFCYLLRQFSYEFSVLAGASLVCQHPLLRFLQSTICGLANNKLLLELEYCVINQSVFITRPRDLCDIQNGGRRRRPWPEYLVTHT